MERITTIQLNRLEDELKKVVRRVDTMQKSLDLLYEDRSILEDIIGKVQSLQEQFALNRNRQEKHTQEVKSDIQGVQEKVETKFDEVGESVDKNIGILVKEMKLKQIITIKEGFFAKLRGLLKK